MRDDAVLRRALPLGRGLGRNPMTKYVKPLTVRVTCLTSQSVSYRDEKVQIISA